MSPDETRIRIAEKIMGWKLYNYETDEQATTPEHYADAMNNDGWRWEGDPDESREAWQFHPESDWNHWREVEEKVMHNPLLIHPYVQNLGELHCPNAHNTKPEWICYCVVKADLPTRAKALFLALHE